MFRKQQNVSSETFKFQQYQLKTRAKHYQNSIAILNKLQLQNKEAVTNETEQNKKINKLTT